MKTNFILYEEEIDQLNAVFSAYKSEISDPNHLDSLGLVERHDIEIEGKTPDFIFFKGGYCFIVECKSGKVNSKNKKQLMGYKDFKREEIEKTIKTLCGKKYNIYKFDVAVVYEEDNLSHNIDSRTERILNELVNKDIAILSIKKGGYLKKYKGIVQNSLEIDNVLQKGIRIPKYPKEVIGIMRDSYLEGVIYYLFEKLLGRIYKTGKKSIFIKESEIHTEIFRNVEIKTLRIKEAIVSLKNLNILEKSEKKGYTLDIKQIEDFQDLKEKLKRKNIGDIIREKMGFKGTLPLDKY